MIAWVPLGDRAVRFARPRAPTRAIVRVVRSWPGVVDVVVSEHDVAAYFDRAPMVPDVSLDDLPDDPEPPRDIVLRAIYDGPDLEDFARSGVDVARVHQSVTYTVETMGFAPGFAYMTGLDPRLCISRRKTPRTRVPAGSIGIAGSYTGVYPFDSPGGWNLIGRVIDVHMFGPDGPLLHLGDRVTFRA